jgi:hypothetical protein
MPSARGRVIGNARCIGHTRSEPQGHPAAGAVAQHYAATLSTLRKTAVANDYAYDKFVPDPFGSEPKWLLPPR